MYSGQFVLPVEIFKVLMYATFENGDDRMVRKLEACIDEFKFSPNITIELLSLNALSSQPESEPLKVIKSVLDVKDCQFSNREAMIAAYRPPVVEINKEEAEGAFAKFKGFFTAKK